MGLTNAPLGYIHDAVLKDKAKVDVVTWKCRKKQHCYAMIGFEGGVLQITNYKLYCAWCEISFLIFKIVFILSATDLQYNLTSDLLHKPSFPHRFYFHGNGSSNSTRGRVRARHSQLTCATHVAYQRVMHSHTCNI